MLIKQTIDVSQHHSFQHILQRYAWEKCRAFLSLLTLLLVLVLTPYAQLEAAQTRQLTVNLTDRLSQQKLSGLSVTAYQRASDGKLKWFANKTTDTQGQAIFTLEGLGFGQNYVLTVNAFNNITTYSKVVSSSGIFAFQVGALSASITSGADGSLLKNYSITAYEILADGKQKWRTSGKTDQQGIIRFDLENLGSGTNYILKAKSPVDSSYKNSQIISNIGKIAFKVGNKALNITLRDSISGQIIAGQKVIVQELLANDKSDWITERTTDANGQIIVDLDGLGAGRSYKLASKVYNNLYSYSDLITTTGSFSFNVGTLAVAVKSGASEKALPDFRITVYERLSDASNKWHASGNTDTSGIIRFDL
ncbi:hypothetical protein [sulfur-oxidizing endosymbiont of Gigantopelta aegis]|uniref:hypothetical protein n=1 Tax=sulfur-oxidizing endosymbiont of Gigantopelta aegis TaxID=2794934 RepID=UPI0018DDB06C|nr:hypothetical protein [sulfur-oxidizing endosymbiont of Gigantopelta aegis]